MIWKLGLSVVVVVVLYLAGVISAARDYGTIGIQYLSKWLAGNIPVQVDIDRLDLSVQRLDAEIASNGRRVVEQAVALDRSASQVVAKERSLAQAKDSLRNLRDKYVSRVDAAVKQQLEDALAKQLARYKAQHQALGLAKSSLVSRRQAYEAMLAAFEKQKLDRDILKEKVASFRAEYETMKMRGELQQTAIANSASRKATDLAIDIADRLEVHRRLAELEVSSTSKSLSIETPVAFELAEVDNVIDSPTPCKSKHMVAR